MMGQGIARKLGSRMERRARTLCQLMVTGGFMMLVASEPANAQSDVQGQSVSERRAEEFASRAVNLGPFEVFPSIELLTEYNDNVLIVNGAEQDDVVFTLRPRVQLRDRRPDRTVEIDLSAGIRKFASIDTEDAEQFRVSAQGLWGLDADTQYRGALRVNRSTEERRNADSFVTVLQPVAFTDMSAEAGVTQELGPVRIALDGLARAVRYDGSTRIGSQDFDLSFRDFEIYRGTGQIRFARSRDREIYLQLTVDKRDYAPPPINTSGQPIFGFNRSSSGGRLEAGYRQQITELLYLDLRAGYLLQDYEEPALDNVDGLAFQADLLWNVTPLTSIEIGGQRRVDETVNPLVSGLVRTEGTFRIEHELLRNLLLTGRGSYARLDQLDSADDGDQWSVGFESNYRVGRNWSITLRGEHYERSGLFDFTQNEIGIGLRYSL